MIFIMNPEYIERFKYMYLTEKNEYHHPVPQCNTHPVLAKLVQYFNKFIDSSPSWSVESVPGKNK